MLGPPLQPYTRLTSFSDLGRVQFLTFSQRESTLRSIQTQVAVLEQRVSELTYSLMCTGQDLECERMRRADEILTLEREIISLRQEILSVPRKSTEFYRISSANDLSTMAGSDVSSVAHSPRPHNFARPPRPMNKLGRVGCALW